MENGLMKYKGYEIDIVRTPWSEFFVVEHHNPNYRPNLDILLEEENNLLGINGGTHIFSTNEYGNNLYWGFPDKNSCNLFSDWINERLDLEISTNSILKKEFKFYGGKLEDLFSEKRLKEEGKKTFELFGGDLKKITYDTKNYLQSLVLPVLLKASCPNKIHFKSDDMPKKLKQDKLGLILTDYSNDSENGKRPFSKTDIYKIIRTRPELIRNGNLFPHYKIFVDGPLSINSLELDIRDTNNMNPNDIILNIKNSSFLLKPYS